MADLLYHNDGKDKSQSHEIYSKDLEGHFDIFLQGFGSTKQLAYEEFIRNLDAYMIKLNEFRKEISIDDTIKVDCFGKPI